MKRGAVFIAMICAACAARSAISDDDEIAFDASAHSDATTTFDASPNEGAVAPDAIVELDASDEPDTLCCDLGVKQSGCQFCNVGDVCWSKVGACFHDAGNCGPDTCNGCCLDDNQCADGREIGTCGSGGVECVECFGKNPETFAACIPQTAGGSCSITESCTAESCVGCCKSGTCLVGNDDKACGHEGNACADCTQSGETCEAHLCQGGHH